MANEITTDANFLGYVSVSGQGYENFWPYHLFNWKMTGVNCATEDYSLGSTSEIAFTFETDMPLEVGQTVKVGTTEYYGPFTFTITSVKKKKTLQNRYDVTCSSNPRVLVNPDSVIEKSDLSRLPANYTLEDLALFAGGDSDAWSDIPIAVNRTYVVNQNWWYQGITYRQLYQWCCQLGGINDAGTLWSEYPENLTYSGAFCPTVPDINNCLFFNSSNVKSIDLANYQSPVIDKIWFGNESTDIGFSLGNGEQSMMFPNNPLINPEDTSFLAPLYNKVHALQSYTPMKIETFQELELGLPPGYHIINGQVYSDEQLLGLPSSTVNRVRNTYRAIWGVWDNTEGLPYTSTYIDQYGIEHPNAKAWNCRNNILRQYCLDVDENALALTAEHLQEYVLKSEPGSFLRLSTSIGDSYGIKNDYLIVDFDEEGLYIIPDSASASTVDYYTWEDFVSANSSYQYILFINFPIGSEVLDIAPETPTGHDIIVPSGAILYMRPYELSNANNIYTILDGDYLTKTISRNDATNNESILYSYGGSVSGVWGVEERNSGYTYTFSSQRAQNKGWNVVIYDNKCLYVKSDVPLEGSQVYEEKITINGHTYSNIPKTHSYGHYHSPNTQPNLTNFFEYHPYTVYSPGLINTAEYNYVDFGLYLNSFNHEEINCFCTIWEYLGWPGATPASDVAKAQPYYSTMNVLKSYADQGIGVPVSSLKTMLDTYGTPGMLVQFSTEVNQQWGSNAVTPTEGGIIIAHWDDDGVYFLFWEYYPRNPDAEPYDDARYNKTLSNWEDYFYLTYEVKTWEQFYSTCSEYNLNYINAMLMPEGKTREEQPVWNGYLFRPIPVGGSSSDDENVFNFNAPKLAWNYFDDGEQYTWMAYTDDDRNTYYCPIFNWEASNNGIVLEGTGNQDRRTENSYLSYDLRTTGKYVDINNAISGTEGEISGVTSTISALNVRVGNVEAAVNNKVDTTDYNGDTIINKINTNGVTQTISSTRVDLSGYVPTTAYTGTNIITAINDSTTVGIIDANKVDLSGYTPPSYTGDSLINSINANGVTSTIDTDRLDLTGYVQSSSLATVATSGSYNDLIDVPTVPLSQVQSDWSQSITTSVDYIKNKPNFASVATSGSYNDLVDTPTIPAAQIQSDWAQSITTSVDYIKNKPTNVSAFTNDAGYVLGEDYNGDTIINNINAAGVTSTINASRVNFIGSLVNDFSDSTVITVYAPAEPSQMYVQSLQFTIPANKNFCAEIQTYKPNDTIGICPQTLVVTDSMIDAQHFSQESVIKIVNSDYRSDRVSVSLIGKPSTTTTYYVWSDVSYQTTTVKVGQSYIGWYM